MIKNIPAWFIFGMILLVVCPVWAIQQVSLEKQNWQALASQGEGIPLSEEVLDGISFGITTYRTGVQALTRHQYDLKNATIYIKWKVHGPKGKYTACGVGVGWTYTNSLSKKGVYFAASAGYTTPSSGVWFTTEHSWGGSKVVQDDIWYYTRMDFSQEKAASVVTATQNYDDQGGTIFSSHHVELKQENWNKLSNASIAANLVDNYGGSQARITIGEATISAKNTDSDATIERPTLDSYASFDAASSLVVIPNLEVNDLSFWVELSLLPTNPLTFQIADLGAGGTGPACATYDLQNNILHIHPICIGSDCWNVDLFLVSVSPFTLQLRDIKHVDPPTVTWDTNTIFETVVNPSSNNQVITDPSSKIKITIPADTFKEPIHYRLSSVHNLPLPIQNVYWSKIVDIDLGGLHFFNNPISLELPLEMDRLPPDIKPTDIHVLHWNKVFNVWEFVPKEVDLEKGVVKLKTKTFSPIAWLCSLKDNYVSSPNGLFNLYYDPDDWSEVYEYPYGSMEEFAQYMGTVFEDAYYYYRDLGFKMPDTPIVVTIYKSHPIRYDITGENETHYAPGQIGNGTIYFKLRKSSSAEIRHDAAHELFHMIQNQNLSDSEMNDNKWFIEAMADLAAYQATGQRLGTNTLQDLNMEFFSEPFNFNDNAHEYQMAHFINFIWKQTSMSLKDFWESMVLKMSLGRVGRSAKIALGNFIYSNLNKTFAEVWLEFVKYALLEDHSMFGLASDSKNFALTAISSDFKVMPIGQTQYWLCQLKNGLSAKSWGIRPVIAQDRNSRKLVLKVDRDIPSGIVVYATIIKNYKDNYKVKHIKTFKEYNSSDEVEIEVKADDAVFIFAVDQTMNQEPATNSFRVSLLDEILIKQCWIRPDGGYLEDGIRKNVTLSCDVLGNPIELWVDLSPLGGSNKVQLNLTETGSWIARAPVQPVESGSKNITFTAKDSNGDTSKNWEIVTVKKHELVANSVKFSDSTENIGITLIFPDDIHARVEVKNDPEAYNSGQLIKIFLKEFPAKYVISDHLPVTLMLEPKKQLRKWYLYSSSKKDDPTFRKLKYESENNELSAALNISGESYYWLTSYPTQGPYYTIIFRLYGDKN